MQAKALARQAELELYYGHLEEGHGLLLQAAQILDAVGPHRENFGALY
jgi:hypothetical protein